MILMWRSRADFLKAIQSMWQNPVRIPAASLWAVRGMGGPGGGMGGPPSGGGNGGGNRGGNGGGGPR